MCTSLVCIGCLYFSLRVHCKSKTRSLIPNRQTSQFKNERGARWYHRGFAFGSIAFIVWNAKLSCFTYFHSIRSHIKTQNQMTLCCIESVGKGRTRCKSTGTAVPKRRTVGEGPRYICFHFHVGAGQRWTLSWDLRDVPCAVCFAVKGNVFAGCTGVDLGLDCAAAEGNDSQKDRNAVHLVVNSRCSSLFCG